MPTATSTTAERSSRLAKRAALLAGAQTVAFALSFVMPLVLVRTLDPAHFGVYKQAFQIVATAISLLNLQVAIGAIYFMAREPEKKLEVALNLILFYTLAGALVAAAFFVYPEWVTLIFQSRDLVPVVPLLGVVILLWAVTTNGDAVAIAAEDFRFASAYIVAAQVGRAVLLIAAALVFSNVSAIVAAAAVQGGLQLGLLLWYVRRRFGRLLTRIDWPLFKAQMQNALPFGIGGFPAVLQLDLHHYFVSHYYDSAAFAVYAVGCFQLPLLSLLTGSFSTAFAPEVARCQETGDSRSIVRVWAGVIRHLTFFLAPAFALLMIVRREFITVLFTQNYEAAVPIFAVNLIGVLLAASAHYPILRAFDSLKYFRLKLYLALLPVTWAALHVGTRAAGLVGAVTAAMFAQILDVIFSVGVVCRTLGVSWMDLRQLLPVVRIVAAVLAASASTVFLKAAIAGFPAAAQLAICAAAFGVAYLVAALATGAITAEEREKIRRAVARFQMASAEAGPGPVSQGTGSE